MQTEIKAARKEQTPAFEALEGGMSYATGEHGWAQTVEAAILRTSVFSNEHRIVYRSTPAIEIEFKGDSDFVTHSREELLAKAMSGTIIVDEKSGALVRIGANLDRNVYDGSELLAAHTIMFLGFDATRLRPNLFLPSSWVKNRYIHGEYQHWWLQSWRRWSFKERWAEFWTGRGPA
ncbi:MAG: hypothetical protein ABSD59_00795 [Terracidiphilus sp.]